MSTGRTVVLKFVFHTSPMTKDAQIKNSFSALMIFHRNPTGNMFVKLLSWIWLRFKLDILYIEGVMNFLMIFLWLSLGGNGAHFVIVLVPT